MPAYPALAATDLENLVAYLSSLRPVRTSPREQADAAVWTFDRLDNIGGHKTTVLGEPRIIDSPVGKAVEFDGVDDALFIDNHPLAGAAAFTWEAIFRPGRRRDGAALVSLERAGSRHRRRHRQPDALRDPGGRRRVVPGQLQPVGSREQGAHEPRRATPARRLVPRRLGVRRQGIQELRRTACGRGLPSSNWPRTARATRRSACGSTRCSTSRAPFASRGSRAGRSHLRSFSSHRPSGDRAHQGTSTVGPRPGWHFDCSYNPQGEQSAKRIWTYRRLGPPIPQSYTG